MTEKGIGVRVARKEDQRFVTDMYLLDIQADGKYVPVKSFDALEDTGSGTQCGS